MTKIYCYDRCTTCKKADFRAVCTGFKEAEWKEVQGV